ncbi:hypothetical protein GWI33_000448 [Rhynchophorus ferrugineus]|uniref:Uncharacterized protein n=1 Tax=Rhynchophorus ferrugineus TaxID=354439 RepID=A0A834M1L2_RHYFE|nr:hypothetical protein GWI33_000450 [Rhynchophorus ferrugineus]KAF7264228.1 hypothetical protein GWI33_000448 [Rhynchophorus ferrugineus]
MGMIYVISFPPSKASSINVASYEATTLRPSSAAENGRFSGKDDRSTHSDRVRASSPGPGAYSGVPRRHTADAVVRLASGGVMASLRGGDRTQQSHTHTLARTLLAGRLAGWRRRRVQTRTLL